MNTQESISSAEESSNNPVKELMTIIQGNKTDDVEKAPATDKATSKAEQKREMARQTRLRKKQEIERMKNNQVHGITLLMTDTSGKIMTHKLSTEADYIEFITSVFDSWKLAKQIVDYRVLTGEQPDL